MWPVNPPLVCSRVGGCSPPMSGNCCASSFCDAEMIISSSHPQSDFPLIRFRSDSCRIYKGLSIQTLSMFLGDIVRASVRSTVSSSVIASKTHSHFWRFSGFFHAALSGVLALFRHIIVEIGGVVGVHTVTCVSACIPSSTPATQHVGATDPGL